MIVSVLLFENEKKCQQNSVVVMIIDSVPETFGIISLFKVEGFDRKWREYKSLWSDEVLEYLKLMISLEGGTKKKSHMLRQHWFEGKYFLSFFEIIFFWVEEEAVGFPVLFRSFESFHFPFSWLFYGMRLLARMMF